MPDARLQRTRDAYRLTAVIKILWQTADWIAFETSCGHAHARPRHAVPELHRGAPFVCWCETPKDPDDRQ